MHDVVVYDEEYHREKTSIQDTCRSIADILSRYQAIMESACTNGAISGETAKALKQYVGYSQCLAADVAQIANLHASAVDGFLNTIDRIDDFLY